MTEHIVMTGTPAVEYVGYHNLGRYAGYRWGFFMLIVKTPIEGGGPALNRELGSAMSPAQKHESGIRTLRRRFVRDNPLVPHVIEPGRYNVGRHFTAWYGNGRPFTEEALFDDIDA